ncbi:MAG: hypothetical protein UT50_C0030G0005 [Candidatus Moranbacteria bacterium GW2011_GWA2_39_41]|nr:MAG: hypothetical protein UT50_C0030G0005 [Candidatus Moranbacteria bacterium GW2011_GWA2_39_41]
MKNVELNGSGNMMINIAIETRKKHMTNKVK